MNWYMMIVVYDKSRIYDSGIWRKMVCHVQVHKIMLRFLFRACAYLPAVAQTRLRLKQWAWCRQLACTSWRKPRRHFLSLHMNTKLPVYYQWTKHPQRALCCPSFYYFLYVTKGGLSAYALCYSSFYYFLYVTTLQSSDKVRWDGRKIKKSSQEVL